MLDKLREMTGGDEERIKLYISTFLEEVPEYCALLDEAIKSKDFEKIRYIAHISKPLLTMMGFDNLHKLADDVETDIRNDAESDQIINRSQSLLAQMNETVESLSEN